MLGYWAEYFYQSFRPGGLVTAKGSSIIGFSFPAAIGLKIACPERPVVAVSGDGGFLYGAQEMATCRRHGIGFPVVVVNDGAYGMIDLLHVKSTAEGTSKQTWLIPTGRPWPPPSVSAPIGSILPRGLNRPLGLL